MEEYTFFWSIKNYSYFWRQTGFNMKSPKLFADVLDGTVWTVSLYPYGRDYVSIFLCRTDEDGPEKIRLHFEIALLAADYSTLWSENGEKEFELGAELDWRVNMYEILLRQKSGSFSRRILIVRVKVWRVAESLPWTGQSCARSRIGVEKMSFVQVEFSSKLEANEKSTETLKSRSKDGLLILCSVHFCSCCEENMVAEISLSDKNQFFTECKVYLLDSSRNAVVCSQSNVVNDTVKNGIVKLTLPLTRKEIMDAKDEYVIFGCFYFLWEFTFTTGIEFQKVEETIFDMSPLSTKNLGKGETLEMLPECTTTLNKNLKEFRDNQFLTDIELKTKTNSVFAHKIVLCARSAYFKDMISNCIQGEIPCIEIDDVDDEALQQLLHFLYSDSFEELVLANALKLYYAAVKYKIQNLQVMCFNFLITNLSTSTATELLVFAHKQNDSHLKRETVDFILNHTREVFRSEEWENFMGNNAKLALQIMHLGYTRKRLMDF